MIRRIQLLRNVGQFDSVDAGANIALAPLTVIYSDNGRGKTTLAAILRSLATGDPLPIAERRRLTAEHPPHVVVDCRGGPPPATFENGAWNRTLPNLVVFDDIFIDQNVHSGLAVETHHRQNLHELILGSQAVGMSRQLQDLVAKVEEHNRDLRGKERAVSAEARGPFSIDEFCALPARPDVDDAIREAERALAAAREQDAVRTTGSFELLTLPAFDLDAIDQLLQRDLPALDRDTLARIQTHLIALGDGGEAWVSDGMHRVVVEAGGPYACPFCAQDLAQSPLVDHYRAYFSDSYASLKREVGQAVAATDQAHGREVPAGFERAVRVAVELRQFWARFCEVQEFTLDTAAIVRDWRAAREAIVAHLRAKQAAPLDPMAVSAGTQALCMAFEAQRAAVAAVNRLLVGANQAIDIAKERVATANTAALSRDLARLRAIKARHQSDVSALCAGYLQERAAKEATEDERDRTKKALEQHRTAVFPGYQNAINLYLPRFNAGFRLDNVSYANTRGGATCTYNVVIYNTPVAVGAASVLGQPSFGNTLSAGDRNTLALAFFFASLDQDAHLADKIVVIDDPISSLDEHRTLATVQEVRRLAERAAQVIVLSHSKPFLCRLWEGADSASRAALEVVRDSDGSSLRVWDVARDSATEHDLRHAMLAKYLRSSQADKREVARAIRPHLEAFLRVASPDLFGPGTLLGPFLNSCEQKLGTSQEILSPDATQELREIVEYANRFHHNTNPAWETETINDGELRGFVERAMTFVRP